MAKTRKEIIQEERLKMSNEERTVLALEEIADQLIQIKGIMKGRASVLSARGKGSILS